MGNIAFANYLEVNMAHDERVCHNNGTGPCGYQTVSMIDRACCLVEDSWMTVRMWSYLAQYTRFPDFRFLVVAYTTRVH